MLCLSGFLQRHADCSVSVFCCLKCETSDLFLCIQDQALPFFICRLKGEENLVMRDYVLPDFSSIKKGFCKV